MDAASCFILGMKMTPLSQAEMSVAQFRNLLKVGRSHKQQLPRTLFVPRGSPNHVATREAIAKGIEVVPVEENELLVFTSGARDSFAEHLQEKRSGGDA
jgi:hypothetical protein